jgi:hypothetical protein
MGKPENTPARAVNGCFCAAMPTKNLTVLLTHIFVVWGSKPKN